MPYDALAENESARQVMGEPALRVIAHELVASIKGNVSVDWMHREAARAFVEKRERLRRDLGGRVWSQPQVIRPKLEKHRLVDDVPAVRQ